MAQVVQCPGGHYYDASVFLECPHCKARLEQGWENPVTDNRDEAARLARRYLQEKKIGRDIRQAFGQKNGSHGEDGEEEVQGKTELQRKAEPQRKEEPQSPENEVTVAFRAPKQSSYFVTGWIVCVDGPDKGHVFSLYQGYHSIGYGRKNQICLLEDLEIARGVHCYLVYDDRKNRFYLVPEGENSVYLKGELLDGPAEIFTGDEFRLGNSTFEFVAFCKDDRKWDRKDIVKRG